MSLLLKISLRNLVRQKRRNILLGTAIAFGMMILVVANSFSHGISDTLFNKIIVYMTGHIDFNVLENGRFRTPITRDLERYENVLSQNLKGVVRIEENLSITGRGIGNGKSDLIVIVGIDIKPEADADIKSYFSLKEGSFKDYANASGKYVNPIMITDQKAKSLNVKLYDTIRIRIQNVYGQQETAFLTVVAIIKSKNIYLDMALYLNKADTKRLMGLKAHETGSLQVVLKDPKSAIAQADKLHSLLTPNIACIYGQVSPNREEVVVLSYKRNTADITELLRSIQVSYNILSLDKDIVLLNQQMANKFKIGQTIEMVYANKFDTQNTTLKYKVSGYYQSQTKDIPANTILLSDDLFFKDYYVNLPKNQGLLENTLTLNPQNKLYKVLGKEYELLERSHTSKDLTKKIKNLSSFKNGSAVLDIRTMYETASAIVKMESALNIITLLAVLVLFFIILIGVVNTLRMTIRERTREIGTIRAIGMQKVDVLRSFVLETFFLTTVSTLSGIFLALLVMWGLGQITFQTESTFSILLVEKHLHFVPRLSAIIFNMLLIILIAVVTAYIPARRAANMSCTEALRHHE